jgi:hypothetical protein
VDWEGNGFSWDCEDHRVVMQSVKCTRGMDGQTVMEDKFHEGGIDRT